MKESPKHARNVQTSKPLNLTKVFAALAYDLQIKHEPLVVQAHGDLCAGRYLSFVSKLEAMNQQQYDSVGGVNHRMHQLASLFVKYPFEDPSIDREKAAIEKFLKSERHCKRMNQKLRLRRFRMEPPHMQHMRTYLLSVLGPEPDIEKVLGGCDFGPGSSVGVHGDETHVLNKLEFLSCTRTALPVALAALQRNKHYWDQLHQLAPLCTDATLPGDGIKASIVHVSYNKITCVPKNAKTDRTIGIEPTLNGFVQKGIDLVLRTKLRRIGIDLSSQALNQALARLGSLGRGYSTLDLAAASDSVSIELVRDLLPPAWFTLLNSTRSPEYLMDGMSEPVRYEKFCSMGNGFCFPLETLLFRAACDYAMTSTLIDAQKTCTVYGDDIIVPQECALLLIEVLRDMGFRTNRDKTFVFGGFRESCGADWFEGVNVRNVYLKEPLKTGFDAYPLLNALSRRKLRQTWQTIFDWLPGHKRYLRPYHRDDDSAITVPLDMFMSSKHAVFDRETFSWQWKKVVVVPTPGRKPRSEVELLLGKLRGDLSQADTFTARFGERTRVQLGS